MNVSRRQLLSGFSATPKALLPGKDILVIIFQRGGADGLNALAPYSDSTYQSLRSAIRVPEPGEVNGAIYLDEYFGLNPALSALVPIYAANDLALIHATGVPHGSRSHFAAQGLLERGTTTQTGPTDGWLGRHLALSAPTQSSAFRIVALSGNVPLMLLGANEPMAINSFTDFGFDEDILATGFADILANLYRSPVPLNSPAHAALDAIDELSAANLSQYSPDNAATYPNSELGTKLSQASQLIKSELPVEVICIDSLGWDHHDDLPNALAASLTDLSNCMATFYTDMGARMENITLMVHSEFGRRVRANTSGGTDHGTAGLAYLVGGGVNGGMINGGQSRSEFWPGLEDLQDGDLKIVTDLRSVMLELLNKRLGGTDARNVFPGFSGNGENNLFNAL